MNDDMNIHDLVNAKTALKIQILDKIRKFEDTTGLLVTGIEIQSVQNATTHFRRVTLSINVIAEVP
jgi:hypothetical protein